MNVILHVFNDPKFSSGYFEFLIRHNISLKYHRLFHYRCKKTICDDYGMNAVFSPHFFSIIPNLFLLKMLFQADKIIIHSLASPFLLFYLYLFPSLSEKAYWAIWGKDLYFYQNLESPRFYHKIYEFFRKKIIKAIPNIIGFSKRDVELARKWYGSKAILHHSFSYPSNCFAGHSCHPLNSNEITILVGNSADPSNRHEDVFNLIRNYKRKNLKIISPLSYGDKEYARRIKILGHSLFGKNFIALEKLLPTEEYLQLLAGVDISIFAHKRQQAMGTIINLIGMKKKVYIRKDITTWGTLNELGIKVYDINKFNISMPNNAILSNNQKIVKNYFSEVNLLHQWLKIFDHRL